MKKTIVAAVLIVALLFNLMNPSEAHADNTAWIVIGSITAFLLVVVIGTLLTRQSDGIFLTEPTADNREDPSAPPALHFGPDCQPTADGQPVMCW